MNLPTAHGRAMRQRNGKARGHRRRADSGRSCVLQRRQNDGAATCGSARCDSPASRGRAPLGRPIKQADLLEHERHKAVAGDVVRSWDVQRDGVHVVHEPLEALDNRHLPLRCPFFCQHFHDACPLACARYTSVMWSQAARSPMPQLEFHGQPYQPEAREPEYASLVRVPPNKARTRPYVPKV